VKQALSRRPVVTAGDPGQFPKLGVTLESDDGDPRRTGPKVLVTAR